MTDSKAPQGESNGAFPESVWQAIIRVLWSTKRGRIGIGVIAVVLCIFAVWNSLPDANKSELISNVGSGDKAATPVEMPTEPNDREIKPNEAVTEPFDQPLQFLGVRCRFEPGVDPTTFSSDDFAVGVKLEYHQLLARLLVHPPDSKGKRGMLWIPRGGGDRSSGGDFIELEETDIWAARNTLYLGSAAPTFGAQFTSDSIKNRMPSDESGEVRLPIDDLKALRYCSVTAYVGGKASPKLKSLYLMLNDFVVPIPFQQSAADATGPFNVSNVETWPVKGVVDPLESAVVHSSYPRARD